MELVDRYICTDLALLVIIRVELFASAEAICEEAYFAFAEHKEYLDASASTMARFDRDCSHEVGRIPQVARGRGFCALSGTEEPR